MKALTRKDDVVRRASVVYGEDPTLWVHEFRYRTRGHKHRMFFKTEQEAVKHSKQEAI